MIPHARPEGECSRCKYFCSKTSLTNRFVECETCARRLTDVTSLLGQYCAQRDVLELLPISVCSENAILPYLEAGDTLLILADFNSKDFAETAEKIRYIVNRDARFLHAKAEEIMKLVHSTAPYSPWPGRLDWQGKDQKEF